MKKGSESLEIKLGFIVGMSRGGTTWMMKALNGGVQIQCFGESLHWGRRYVRPALGVYYSADEILKIKRNWMNQRLELCGDAPREGRHVQQRWWGDFIENIRWPEEGGTPREVYDAIISAIHESFGGKWFIEKTPHHLLFADRILGNIPDARFILMRREAYAFMRSYKHQGDRKEPGARRYFQNLYHPLVCALLWKRYAKASDELLRSQPHRVIELSIDAPNFDPGMAVRQVYAFLGLELAKDLDIEDSRNSSFEGGNKPELVSIDIFWMNLIAGRYMRQNGISIRKSRVSVYMIVNSLVDLIRWGLFCTTEVIGRIQGSKIGYLKRWLYRAYPRV